MKDQKIEDIQANEDEEENEVKTVCLPWYMVNGEGSAIKTWDFFITLITIYSMILTPFVLVYP